jgi:hypothetical protein
MNKITKPALEKKLIFLKFLKLVKPLAIFFISLSWVRLTAIAMAPKAYTSPS